MKKLLLTVLFILMISSFSSPLTSFAQPAGYENITLYVEGRSATTGFNCACEGRAYITHGSSTDEVQLPYEGHLSNWEIPTWRYYGPNFLINQRWESQLWGVIGHANWHSADMESIDLHDNSLHHTHILHPPTLEVE